MAYARYSKRVLTGLISTAIVIVAINIGVDPYGAFNVVTLPGFNSEKLERLAGGGRVTKSLDLRRADYDVLVLGTSRTQIGIDPKSPALNGRATYNAALSGTTMVELHRVGLYALDHRQPTDLVLGLDFMAYTTRFSTWGDFDESGFAGRSVAFMYPRRIFSLSALRDSFVTVVTNRLGLKSYQRGDGFHDAALRWGNKEPRSLFTRILANNFFVNPDTYAEFDYGVDRVQLTHDLMGRYARAGVRVHAFISPIHARQQEALDAMVLYKTFERWKRDIVTVVAALNNEPRADGPRIALWDFSGFNSVTTEPVPSSGSQESTRWYWESSHFKRELGDIVLARMLASDSTSAPADFGVLLSPEMIDRHLADIEDARRQYHRDQPQEIADIARLLRQSVVRRRAPVR